MMILKYLIILCFIAANIFAMEIPQENQLHKLIETSNKQENQLHKLIESSNKNIENIAFGGCQDFFLYNSDSKVGDRYGILVRQEEDTRRDEHPSLIPVGLTLLLSVKAEDLIEQTSVIFLRYPKFPNIKEGAARSSGDLQHYLSNVGGVFHQFKEFLKKKINLKKDFNLFVVLPDLHTTLIAFRVVENINKLFVIDSVGSLMKNGAALSETINKAFKETEFANNSYILFGTSIRQADTWSCSVIAFNDFLNITSYPHLLDAIWQSIPEENLCSVANTINETKWANIFTKLPVQFYKISQIFPEKLIAERRGEIFADSQESIGSYINRIEKSPLLESNKVGSYYQSLDQTDELTGAYIEELSSAIEKLSNEQIRDIFNKSYVNLYSAFQCSNCYELPSAEGALFKKCSKCKNMRYCSKDCQTEHWNSGHKKQCKKL